MFFRINFCWKRSFNSNTLIGGVFFHKPYLTIDFVVVSHKFNPTPYFRDITDRKTIHNRIIELKNDGLGYRRIHKILTDEKFKIGKSPTCVDTMIKKIIQREFILNQEIIQEFGKIRIEIF